MFTGLTLLPQLSQSICPVSCPLCPCFDMDTQTISISEDVSIGSTLFTFVATDSQSLTLTYSIRNPPPNDFEINSMTGELTVARKLDFETRQRYDFRVTAENTDSRRGNIDVIVDITNADDNPTMCSESVVSFSVVEEQLSRPFRLPACTDDDMPSNPSFDYTIITGNDSGLFLINEGNLSLSRPLDYEIQVLHEISINVAQLGGFLGFNISVIIQVLPVNEFPPQFSSTAIHLIVLESAPIASSVGVISASDSDAGSDGVIIYSITSQSSDKFTINPNSGEIIVTRSLDYETIQSFSLTILARDSPSPGSGTQQSATAQVQISIQDENDNRPYFTSYVRYAGVSEHSYSVGDIAVADMECNDRDSGANQEVTYSIVKGNQEGKFRINSTSGEVTLTSNLNYEGNNTQLYNLTIECQEVEPPQGIAQSSLLVGVESFNEFNPDPGADYVATVSEDTPPGTSVLRVQGRDPDRGPAGELAYYINQDDTQYCPNGLLYIDRFTGMVYLNSPLDYENGLTTIHCTIIVWDSEPPLKRAIADLFVTVTNANDAAPHCDPPMYKSTLSEDSSTGHEVVALSCSDADSPILSYSILDGELVPFYITSDGVLILNGSLDYETNSSYSILVQVSDGNFSFNASVFVEIKGVNEHSPYFSQAMYICSIDENEAVGTAVCSVSATDEDGGLDGTLNYRIVPSHSDDPFTIDRESGQIYLSKRVDYERDSSFTLLMESYDLGEPSLTSTISVTVHIVDLNDNHPSMRSFAFFSVSENAALGERVGVLDCIDADSARNAQVSLQLNSITKVDENGTETLISDALFTLDSATGVITVSGDLDYETNRLYRLSTLCRDSGTPSLATFSMVTVHINAENEFVPSFNQLAYSIDVSENTPIGSSILVVSATDDDGGVQGDIFFSIQASSNHPFAINSQSGVITLSSKLDCLQSLTYVLPVVARDGGNPPLQSQVNVLLNVVGCRLGDLVPQRSVYVGSVEENSATGTSILTVSCNSSRASLGLSYLPKYRIFDGSDTSSNLFQIDEDSGQLSILTSPDFEAAASHLLYLQCFDENYPEVTVNITTYVFVLPVNEHGPAFSENPYTVSIEESRPLGSAVFAVSASDLDNGRDGEIAYSIGGDDAHYFFVNAHSGVVYLAQSLDRESQTELSFVVSAYDNPGDVSSQRSTSSTVNIQVTDSNDHWPQCNRTVYHLIVSPHTEIGSIILSGLGCSDIDVGLNGELEYVLGDSESEETFALDRNKGELELISYLDTEVAISYHIPIIVRDLGTPSLSISVLVVIDVQEPPLSDDVDASNSDQPTLLEFEGLKNAVTIILSDISIDLVSE